jgi:hypothetical protein
MSNFGVTFLNLSDAEVFLKAPLIQHQFGFR